MGNKRRGGPTVVGGGEEEEEGENAIMQLHQDQASTKRAHYSRLQDAGGRFDFASWGRGGGRFDFASWGVGQSFGTRRPVCLESAASETKKTSMKTIRRLLASQQPTAPRASAWCSAACQPNYYRTTSAHRPTYAGEN